MLNVQRELYAENISFNESFTSIAGLMGQKIKKNAKRCTVRPKSSFWPNNARTSEVATAVIGSIETAEKFNYGLQSSRIAMFETNHKQKSNIIMAVHNSGCSHVNVTSFVLHCNVIHYEVRG